MAEEVGSLRVSVRANASEIASDLGKVKSIVNSAAAQMQRGMVAFGKGASGAVGEIFNLRNAVIGLAGGAFISLIKRSVEWADNIGEAADMANVSSKSLQELRYAFKLAGVATEETDKALMVLNKNLGEAQFKANDTSMALARLGISMVDLKGKRADEVLKMVADRLGNVKDGFSRAAIVTDILNAKIGQKLLPTLLQGSGHLNKLAADAHKMGLVLSEETLKKASDASDEFDNLGTAMKVAGVKASVELLPVLIDLRKVFTSAEFQNGVNDAAVSFGKLIKIMVEHKDDVVMIAAAFAGMRIGAAFGPLGAAVGAAVGAVGVKLGDLQTEAENFSKIVRDNAKQMLVLKQAAEKETDVNNLRAIGDQMLFLSIQSEEARKQLQRLKGEAETAPDKPKIEIPPPLISPEVQKAIDDLIFKTRVLKGDFAGLAEGFPEAARGMQRFGVAGREAVTSVQKLSPELQAFNDAMLAQNAAKVIDGIKTSTEKYNEQLARLQQLLAAGKLSAEQFRTAVQGIQFPSLTRAVDDANNLNKQFDGFAVNSVNTIADSLTDLATGAKTAQEAFADMAKAIIRDLIQMTIKAMLFQYVVGPMMGITPGGGAGMPVSPAPTMPTPAGMPTFPKPASAAGYDHAEAGAAPTGSINYAPVYNVQGSGPEIAELRARMDKDRREFPAIAARVVNEKRSRHK